MGHRLSPRFNNLKALLDCKSIAQFIILLASGLIVSKPFKATLIIGLKGEKIVKFRYKRPSACLRPYPRPSSHLPPFPPLLNSSLLPSLPPGLSPLLNSAHSFRLLCLNTSAQLLWKLGARVCVCANPLRVSVKQSFMCVHRAVCFSKWSWSAAVHQWSWLQTREYSNLTALFFNLHTSCLLDFLKIYCWFFFSFEKNRTLLLLSFWNPPTGITFYPVSGIVQHLFFGF